jgi:hypothetical protein
MKFFISTYIIILIGTLSASSQLNAVPNFVHLYNNKFLNTNPESFEQLRNLFTDLKIKNNNKINIVHIGDSHLQAGMLTEVIKNNLINSFNNNDTAIAPGFIFPYTIAETNNPYYYKVNYSGNFRYYKSVDKEKTCKLGLSGITLQTNDSIASIDIKMRKQKGLLKYQFNTIEILHDKPSNYKLTINNRLANYTDNTKSVFKLNKYTDSIHLEIINQNNSAKNFSFYGIILNNNLNGINYHTIGINGATASSYLKCELFSQQLKELNPDWIIVSLGTNEAYNKNFELAKFKKDYNKLLNKIISDIPNAYILITTPGDHLINKENVNKNIPIVCNSIINIATNKNIGIWDFYEIMGGKNSINKWYNNILKIAQCSLPDYTFGDFLR